MNKSLVKVKGEPGLFRDSTSGGIIADDLAFARYKAEREKRLRELTQEARINRLEHEVSKLSSMVGELLSTLRSTNGNSTS